MDEAFDFRGHWEKAFLWALQLPATLTESERADGLAWLENWMDGLPSGCDCREHWDEAKKLSPIPFDKGGGWVLYWLVTFKDYINRLLNKAIWFPGSKGSLLVVMADQKMRAQKNVTGKCCNSPVKP